MRLPRAHARRDRVSMHPRDLPPRAPQMPAAAEAGGEMFEALKDDPDLADVFTDVKENGMAALQKWVGVWGCGWRFAEWGRWQDGLGAGGGARRAARTRPDAPLCRYYRS
jgi:hypothetical protein